MELHQGFFIVPLLHKLQAFGNQRMLGGFLRFLRLVFATGNG
jgi:hypothetical protein